MMTYHAVRLFVSGALNASTFDVPSSRHGYASRLYSIDVQMATYTW